MRRRLSNGRLAPSGTRMTEPIRPPARPVDRIAAVIALVSLAPALLLVIVGALTDWEGALVSSSGILVLVLGGWYVVSRRGPTRTVALLAFPLGVGLLVAGFLF